MTDEATKPPPSCVEVRWPQPKYHLRYASIAVGAALRHGIKASPLHRPSGRPLPRGDVLRLPQVSALQEGPLLGDQVRDVPARGAHLLCQAKTVERGGSVESRTLTATGTSWTYSSRWERKDDDVFTLKVRPGETPGATFWFKEKGEVSTAGKSDLVFITHQV